MILSNINKLMEQDSVKVQLAQLVGKISIYKIIMKYTDYLYWTGIACFYNK